MVEETLARYEWRERKEGREGGRGGRERREKEKGGRGGRKKRKGEKGGRGGEKKEHWLNFYLKWTIDLSITGHTLPCIVCRM